MLKSCEMIAPLNQKNRSWCYARCLSCLVFCGLLIAAGHGEAQQENWAVPSAALRVDVSVSRDPDHPDLGVFVKIPNGGLFPGKFRVPEVRDAQGKPLESVIVADSQTDGFGVLFAQPNDGKNATVYITPSANSPQRPTNTRLFPSTIFFSKNGNASLSVARRMERDYPPAQGASFDVWDHGIGSMVNPFGPDDDFSTWIVGAFVLEKKGAHLLLHDFG